MILNDGLIEKLDLLQTKFEAMGQDMPSYLDGLLYADYLTYWDYIRLDSLLSLQQPRTNFPDERIFILYHQATEIYFKLIIDALEQLSDPATFTLALFKRQLERVNRYFDILSYSFGVMIEGMDKAEFLQYRMSLLPASGFQSVQYRLIELLSTDLNLLVHFSKRADLTSSTDFELLYDNIYWKSGATELATGKKTLTLKQFEKKYRDSLLSTAQKHKTTNLRQLYFCLLPEEQDEALKNLLRQHDHNVNVKWPLQHFRSAMRYLDNKPHVISATGGTNWQAYLPPKNQRIVFFPELWTDEEYDDWGKKITF